MAKKPSLALLDPGTSVTDLGSLLRDLDTSPEQQNRRRAKRTPQSFVLVIQPLNNQFEPVGNPFKAITRDVSDTGLGFLHDEAFPTSFVRIGVTEKSKAQSIAKVCYNKAIHREKLVYLIGVQFISP